MCDTSVCWIKCWSSMTWRGRRANLMYIKQSIAPPTRQISAVYIHSNTHGNWIIINCKIYGSLTHWGRVTHICVGNTTIIGSDNGLSPGRRQTIIWTNAGILLIGPLGTNFSEIFIEIHTFSFKKCIRKCRLRNGVHLSRPQCVKWCS